MTRKEFLASFGKGLLGAAVCGAAAGTPAEAAQAPSLPFALVQSGMLMPGLDKPLGLAFDQKDQLYVAGEQGVKVFDAQGRPLALIRTSGPAVAVALDGLEGHLYAAQRTRIEKLDAQDGQVKAWGEKGDEPGQLRYVTGIAVTDRFVYVSDSGARKIHRYAVDGDYIDEITGPAEDKKFIIPSAYFDCKLDASDTLIVGHTGMHRVERYDADGKLIGHWGTFSSTLEGFCGCCNPTNIAIFKDGRVATTEKGVPRLKVYDAAGKLLACLNEKEFPGNTAGMALAIDSRGRIALAEPVTKQVRFYELKPNKGLS